VAKVALLLGFFAITSPTAAHVVAKCALHTGVRPWIGEEGSPEGRTEVREGEPSKP
ncbi:MAG: hypothetical protein RL562_3512, partial [Planctomycetota bacterium]